MSYNYYEAVKSDVLNAIREYDFSEFEDLDEFREKLNEDLWINDSVTGNGSGSYTFNCRTAQGYVLDNIDLLHEAAEALGSKEQFSRWLWNEEYESLDVSIRCYMLPPRIDDVLEELEEEFDAAHKEEEEN